MGEALHQADFQGRADRHKDHGNVQRILLRGHPGYCAPYGEQVDLRHEVSKCFLDLRESIAPIFENERFAGQVAQSRQ